MKKSPNTAEIRSASAEAPPEKLLGQAAASPKKLDDQAAASRKKLGERAAASRKRLGERAAGSSLILALLLLWQFLSMSSFIPRYMLPSPAEVLLALLRDLPLLLLHLRATLVEAGLGLAAGIAAGFCFALLMDRFSFFRRAFYPLTVLTQTIPPVAIAPLLVLWMGYGLLPKISLVFLTSFFPITVNLLDGFQSADQDEIRLLRAMGASAGQIFRYIKWPGSLNAFFSALRVSSSYALIGAVIAEWMGGNEGLGVYMMRVKKSYDFDKMFAVIFLISFLSLLLLALVRLLQKWAMPWQNLTGGNSKKNQ